MKKTRKITNHNKETKIENQMKKEFKSGLLQDEGSKNVRSNLQLKIKRRNNNRCKNNIKGKNLTTNKTASTTTTTTKIQQYQNLKENKNHKNKHKNNDNNIAQKQ